MIKKTFSNCNHCARRDCSKLVYRAQDPEKDCLVWIDPSEKMMLAELVLYHPQSLHESLTSLPFKTDLTFHLR